MSNSRLYDVDLFPSRPKEGKLVSILACLNILKVKDVGYRMLEGVANLLYLTVQISIR
jgi:hypothetical protein